MCACVWASLCVCVCVSVVKVAMAHIGAPCSGPFQTKNHPPRPHAVLPAAASSSPQHSRLLPRSIARSATTASQDTSPLSFPDSGESVQVRSKESVQKEARYLSLKEHKSFKHGREVPPAVQLQYLKSQLLAQALAHHKFVFNLPKRVRNDPEDLQVMVTQANSIKGFLYVECDIISPKHLRESALIQLPVVRRNTPSTDHKDNVRDLFNNIFNSPATLADIGISEQRKELASYSSGVDHRNLQCPRKW